MKKRSFVQYKKNTDIQLEQLNSNWYLCPFCIICQIKPHGKLGCFWWETECGKYSKLSKDTQEMEERLDIVNLKSWRSI